MNNQRNRLLLLIVCGALSACATPARAQAAKADASPASSWKFVVGGDSAIAETSSCPWSPPGNSAGASFLLAPRGLRAL
jgi:hypothetical protein